MAKRKWYVIFNGFETGVTDSWQECQMRTHGYPRAEYKSYNTQDEAVAAYRAYFEPTAADLVKAIATAPVERSKPVDYPEILRGSIAVDAACSGNPGVMEYRGVWIDSGQQVFKQGPFPEGTNNIGEFLAIVHALAYCYNNGLDAAIYSDSVSGMAWVRRKHANTQLPPSEKNAQLMDIVRRAENWLRTHRWNNPVFKWQTDKWGEIPADFGRK